MFSLYQVVFEVYISPYVQLMYIAVRTLSGPLKLVRSGPKFGRCRNAMVSQGVAATAQEKEESYEKKSRRLDTPEYQH